MAQQYSPDPDWRHKEIKIDRFVYEMAAGILLIAVAMLVGLALFPDDKGFQGNLYTTVLGVLITIFVLDRRAERREQRRAEYELKERLVRELRSDVEDVAKRAVEELRDKGWHKDGTLSRRDLSNAKKLQRIYLREANMQDTNLQMTNLQNSDLVGSNLQRIFATGANLKGSILTDTNLQNAVLPGADLRDAYFWRANVQDADLASGTSSQKARFEYARLNRAALVHSNFQEADFKGADMQGVQAQGANLEKANLLGANLQDSNFSNVNLSGANLQGANVRNVQFDQSTILPDGKYWKHDPEMERFTDPNHPEFWRSDDPNSPAYRGKTK